MKKFLSVLLSSLIFFNTVQATETQGPVPSNYSLAFLKSKPQPATSALAMMETTVQITVKVKATLTFKDENGKVTTIAQEGGASGSGFVYDNNGKESLILSANHVLDVPKVGSEEEVFVEIFGIKIHTGTRKITFVEIKIKTNAGEVCNLTPLKLGVNDHRDVATGLADCDAGRVAKIARSMPVRGAKLYTSGHSLGVELPMVTDGYYSGIMNNYMLMTVPAIGGNSGGPVFYNGEVVGILVRGAEIYPHLTLAAPLEQILLRIQDTNGL